MSTGFVKYKRAEAEVAGRPSPNIWGDCPVSEINNNPAKGFHVFEDFLDLAAGLTTVAGARFYSYLDAGGTLVLADDPKGAIELKTDATDNDSTTLISGNNTTGCILPADGVDKKWWFEARVKVNTITDGDIAWFIGLTEEGQAADSKPMADDSTHEINDIDHIGFHVDGADGDAMNFVYNLAGQTPIEVAGVKAVEVDTYVSIGLKYEPKDNKVRVFIDGVENIGAAFLLSVAAAPLDNLAVCLSMKADGGAANSDKVTIDWVRYAQEY